MMKSIEIVSGEGFGSMGDYLQTTSELFRNLDDAIVEYNKNKSPVHGREIKYYVDALLGCLNFEKQNGDLPMKYADVNSFIEETLRKIKAESYFGRELSEGVVESLDKYFSECTLPKEQSPSAGQGYVVHLVDDGKKPREEKSVEVPLPSGK